MTNPLGGGLCMLVFLLFTSVWFQFASALPGAESILTHFIAVLVSGIAGLMAYAWAENAVAPR